MRVENAKASFRDGKRKRGSRCLDSPATSEGRLTGRSAAKEHPQEGALIREPVPTLGIGQLETDPGRLADVGMQTHTEGRLSTINARRRATRLSKLDTPAPNSVRSL